MPGGNAWRQFQQSFPRSTPQEQGLHPGPAGGWQNFGGQQGAGLDGLGFPAYHHTGSHSAGFAPFQYSSQQFEQQQQPTYNPGLHYQANPGMSLTHHQGHADYPGRQQNKRQRLNDPQLPLTMPLVPSSYPLPAQASEQLPSSFFGGHLIPQHQFNQAAPPYRAAPQLQADHAAPVHHSSQQTRIGAGLQQTAPARQAAVRPQPDHAAPAPHPGPRPKIGTAYPSRPPMQQNLQSQQQKRQQELQHVRDIRGQHPPKKQAPANAVSQGQIHPQQAAQQHHQPVRNAVAEPPEYPNLPNSKLHNDLLDFATQATPTLEELQRVVEVVHRIGKQACDLWPSAKTALFGSQANGLSLPGSDLDIVVLGVSDNLQQAGSGFAKCMRKQLCNMLRDLLRLLRRCGLVIGKGQIIEARVPIIKCKVTIGSSHLAADISLGTANGLSSVQYIGWQLSRLPAIRPLTLAIKALLRELGLNEVFSGGLSSYSIVNMVMAYLSLEGMSLTAHMQPGVAALPEISHTVSSPPPAQQDVAWRIQQTFSGHTQQDMDCDLGAVLKGFLDHFGNNFDNRAKAVSVHFGGFINKRPEWRDRKKPNALAVEDPQEPGKDIAAGTFRIPEIKEVFQQALQELEENPESEGPSSQGWAQVQAEGQDRSTSAGCSELSAILDLHAAVGRDHRAHQARKEFEAKARSNASPKMKMVIKIQRKVRVALPRVGRAAPANRLQPQTPGKHKKGKGKRPPASGKRHQQLPGSLGKKRRRMMERTGNFE